MRKISTGPEMTVWPALLLAPLLAIGHGSIATSLVTPSCARQDDTGLHGLTAFTFLLALALTWLAWRTWSELTRVNDPVPDTAGDAADGNSRQRFIASLATLVGTLSSLVIVALWVPLWFLPPCS